MRSKFSFTLLLLFSTHILISQTISRSNLATAGDVLSNSSGVTLSWTIGEVFSNTVQQANHITGGFQQGILPKKNKPVEKESTSIDPEQRINSTTNNKINSDLQIILFPNPTVDQLWLKSNTSDSYNVVLSIMDTSGKNHIQKNITLENFQEVEINQIDKLASGNYILVLSDNKSTIASKQFIKL